MPYLRPAHWRLHTQRGQRKYLNPDERRRFLAAADSAAPELRAFCYMLAWTGCRLSEGLALSSADLDPAGSIAVRSLKKRGRTVVREVPVPVQVVQHPASSSARPGRSGSGGARPRGGTSRT